MSIIQRVPWTVQPQGIAFPAQLQTPNSAVWVPSQGRRNIIGLKENFLATNGGALEQAGTRGLAWTTSGQSLASSAGANWNTRSTLGSNASQLTMFALFESFDAVSASGFGAVMGSAALIFQFHHSSTSFQRGFFINNGSNQTVQFAAPPANVPVLWVGTWDGAVGGGGLRAYTNGVLDNSQSITGSIGNDPNPIRINSREGNYAWNGRVYAAGVERRAWSAAEVAAFSANIWSRLFAPQARRIWVPVSAGGGTTVTGVLGTATASGFAATIGANRLVAGALGTATATGYTATISTSTDTTVSGVLGTATATGYTATIGANRLVAGVLGTATATGYTATISNSNDRTVAGVLGTATATGFTATVAFNRFIAAVLGTANATGYTASISTASPTIGRPASDASNSGWTASTGSNLYAMLDEVTPDAADYIVTTATGSVCELPLQTTAYPGTASQVLSYRASSSTGNSVIVRLKNTGGATVRTETQVLTASDTLYQITLTAGEIAAITSGALSVELESA